MTTHRISIFGPIRDTPAQQARRSPVKWLGAMAFHIVIVAALIITPLYATGTIHLKRIQ